ncbi:MAG: hypothetical protein DMF84_22145 [Acidobacteria bacterium]|nr:MAG: hypothetical protein DMF84_22145 [Acidobacteriota bacterium]
MDDAERAQILQQLYGPTRTKLRHTSELIPPERKLITDYRALDDQARAIVRLLMDRLAIVPDADGAR